MAPKPANYGRERVDKASKDVRKVGLLHCQRLVRGGGLYLGYEMVLSQRRKRELT